MAEGWSAEAETAVLRWLSKHNYYTASSALQQQSSATVCSSSSRIDIDELVNLHPAALQAAKDVHFHLHSPAQPPDRQSDQRYDQCSGRADDRQRDRTTTVTNSMPDRLDTCKRNEHVTTPSTDNPSQQPTPAMPPASTSSHDVDANATPMLTEWETEELSNSGDEA
jgi:hypothetical protein